MRGISIIPGPMGLDLVELVMEVEEHFDVPLPDSELTQVRTVADLANLVASKLPSSGVDDPVECQQTLDVIREITASQLGFRLDQVHPDSEFVRDLGAG